MNAHSPATSSATFVGDKSMRINYEGGVDSYYLATGSDYRNPHFEGIVKATAYLLDVWWSTFYSQQKMGRREKGKLKFLDLACGSGEATQAIQKWWSGESRPTSRVKPPGQKQIMHGGLPSMDGSQDLQKNLPPNQSGLSVLHPCDVFLIQIDATDPYTHNAYLRWVGEAAERHSFQDIADGCLADRAYHLCICSYALHVLEDSKLFSTLLQLSLVTKHLMVLSPHKRPTITTNMGWELLECKVVERVHAWLYESINMLQDQDLIDMQEGESSREGKEHDGCVIDPPTLL